MRISLRLCLMCASLSWPVLSSDTCTTVYLLIPLHLPLVCFCLVASRLPYGMSLIRLGLCTLDIAAPAFAKASVRLFNIHQCVVSVHVCHRYVCCSSLTHLVYVLPHVMVSHRLLALRHPPLAFRHMQIGKDVHTPL